MTGNTSVSFQMLVRGDLLMDTFISKAKLTDPQGHYYPPIAKVLTKHQIETAKER
jgi:hypothetical protein